MFNNDKTVIYGGFFLLPSRIDHSNNNMHFKSHTNYIIL